MNAMKAILGLGACCVALVAGAATDKTPASRPIRMQITVSVPPSMNMIRDDDVADAFAYRVAAALHEQGFTGGINYVRAGEDTRTDVPVLAINLVEWRVDRVGNVDCTFTASVAGPRGNKDLGLFTGMSMMMWPRHDVFARAEGFDDAARSALGDLAKRIEETQLIPSAGTNA